jgi:uncharacterized protein
MIDTQLICYFFVLLSIYGLWIFNLNIVIGVSTLSLILALITDVVDIIGITMISSYYCMIAFFYRYAKYTAIKFTLFLTIFIFSILLFRNEIPGIYNWHIIDNEIIKFQAVQYSLWLNIDKCVVAMAFGIFALTPITKVTEFNIAFRKAAPTYLLCVTSLIVFGITSNLVDFDPKLPDLWLIWMIVNFATSCIAEELFFRSFVQKNITLALHNTLFAKFFAILICAIIFATFMPSHKAMLPLSFIAGCFYGYAYAKTGKVEVSIILHFIVNSTHLFFFTYPYRDFSYFM